MITYLIAYLKDLSLPWSLLVVTLQLFDAPHTLEYPQFNTKFRILSEKGIPYNVTL
jgi:hypothetical protein